MFLLANHSRWNKESSWLCCWSSVLLTTLKMIFFFLQGAHFKNRLWLVFLRGYSTNAFILWNGFSFLCMGYFISCWHSWASTTPVFHSYRDCVLQHDSKQMLLTRLDYILHARCFKSEWHLPPRVPRSCCFVYIWLTFLKIRVSIFTRKFCTKMALLTSIKGWEQKTHQYVTYIKSWS